RIGAQVVAAFVNKKRREAGNLPADKPTAPVEVGAVWSTPADAPAAKRATPQMAKSHMAGGRFYVQDGRVIAGDGTTAQGGPKPTTHSASAPAIKSSKSPPEIAAAKPERRPETRKDP
ncbi:MAG: hypothetical protein ACRD3S_10140, partial [Terracidiphilus sp.]